MKRSPFNSGFQAVLLSVGVDFSMHLKKKCVFEKNVHFKKNPDADGSLCLECLYISLWLW